MSVTPTKEDYESAKAICAMHYGKLSYEEHDAVALIAIAYDAGAPIRRQDYEKGMAIISRFRTN